GTGGRDEYELMRGTVDGCGKQGLFFFADSLGRGFVIILLPGETNSIQKWIFDEQTDKNAQTSSSANPFVKMHLDNVAANIAKGLMLRGTVYFRPDIEKLVNDGIRTLLVGHPSWPWTVAPIDPS